MKSRPCSIMLLIALGFAPMAISTAVAREAGAPTETAKVEASPPQHGAYLQSTRDEVHVWRVRLDKFADSATAKSPGGKEGRRGGPGQGLEQDPRCGGQARNSQRRGLEEREGVLQESVRRTGCGLVEDCR